MSLSGETDGPPAAAAAPGGHPEALAAAWRASRLRHHGFFLAGSLAVLAIAAACRVQSEDAVYVRFVDLRLPSTCYFNRLVGQPCAGCGMTRAFVCLAVGDVAGAWRFNPAGIVLFGAMLCQYPYRAWQMGRLWRGRGEWRLRGGTVLIWLFLAALFAQWVWRLAGTS